MPGITGTNTGGSPITSYVLYWDNGLDGLYFSNLVGENSHSLIQTFTATGLTSGQSYEFKYKVKNAFGSSSFSSVVTQVAFTYPGLISPVQTSLVGTAVQFTWTQPFTGGSGISITEYDLLVYNKVTAVYTTSPIAITNPFNLAFSIDMSVLVGPSSTYQYSQGDLIQAIV